MRLHQESTTASAQAESAWPCPCPWHGRRRSHGTTSTAVRCITKYCSANWVFYLLACRVKTKSKQDLAVSLQFSTICRSRSVGQDLWSHKIEIRSFALRQGSAFAYSIISLRRSSTSFVSSKDQILFGNVEKCVRLE